MRSRPRAALALAVLTLTLVLGASFGHGALPAAFVAAVFAGQLCGHAAPVAAGLAEFGEGDGHSPVPPVAASAASVVAPSVSGTPSSGLQTAGADVLPPGVPERLHGLLVVVVGAPQRARHLREPELLGVLSFFSRYQVE